MNSTRFLPTSLTGFSVGRAVEVMIALCAGVAGMSVEAVGSWTGATGLAVILPAPVIVLDTVAVSALTPAPVDASAVGAGCVIVTGIGVGAGTGGRVETGVVVGIVVWRVVTKGAGLRLGKTAAGCV